MQRAHLRTGAVVVALTILVCVVAVAGRQPPRGSPSEPTERRDQPADVAVTPPAEFPVPGALPPEVFVIGSEEDSGAPAWPLLTIAAITLAAVLAALVVLVAGLRRGGGRSRLSRSGRRAAREKTEPQPSSGDTTADAEAARRAVDAAMEPLHRAADARAAVIEAYARMEQALAERELGLRPPEAPREYLGRLLLEQGMPERSLTALTALFEEARFSLHPIPQSARRRALSELETARGAIAARDERD
jgi:Domain of unknown function (DUF4129)